jgi:hypothetical protein
MNPKTPQWKVALDIFLDKTYTHVTENNIAWALVGSVATYLQGCKISPKDIDILVKDPASVYIFAEYLKEFFHTGECEYSTFLDEKGETLWFSTEKTPVDVCTDEGGFKWVFARVLIHEITVEISHITAPEGHPILTAGIWEAGPEIWPYITQVIYNNYVLPVVPLEIQLGTNMSRGFNERVDKIVNIFKRNTYNQNLLKKSLNPEQYTLIQTRLEQIE